MRDQERSGYHNSPIRRAVLASLAPRLSQLLSIAMMLYLSLEACAKFIGMYHPVTNSIRLLTGIAAMLYAIPVWLSAEPRLVRMLFRRARPVYFVLSVLIGDLALNPLMLWSRMCDGGCGWFQMVSRALFTGAIAFVFIAIPFVDSLYVSRRLICFSGFCGGLARLFVCVWCKAAPVACNAKYRDYRWVVTSPSRATNATHNGSNTATLASTEHLVFSTLDMVNDMHLLQAIICLQVFWASITEPRATLVIKAHACIRTPCACTWMHRDTGTKASVRAGAVVENKSACGAKVRKRVREHVRTGGWRGCR